MYQKSLNNKSISFDLLFYALNKSSKDFASLLKDHIG